MSDERRALTAFERRTGKFDSLGAKRLHLRAGNGMLDHARIDAVQRELRLHPRDMTRRDDIPTGRRNHGKRRLHAIAIGHIPDLGCLRIVDRDERTRDVRRLACVRVAPEIYPPRAGIIESFSRSARLRRLAPTRRIVEHDFAAAQAARFDISLLREP